MSQKAIQVHNFLNFNFCTQKAVIIKNVVKLHVKSLDIDNITDLSALKHEAKSVVLKRSGTGITIIVTT